MTEEEKKQLNKFESRLKVKFNSLDLLRHSLIHKSYLNEVRGKGISHNERLEFLGDAVLELVITRYLFENYPDRPEGELTSFRAAVVRTESLAETADELDFGKYIYMSKGEEATGGRKRPFILANTFEAVIGAIYLDHNLEECHKFIESTLVPKIDIIVKNRLDIDAKSKLQEISQEKVKETPTYVLVSEEGPDHNKIFTVAVTIKNIELKKGRGRSKQEAEQKAARSTLKHWKEIAGKLE
ncbi:ribonuclease III [Candidatus Dojkabacteria bacterium]|nr:ribonuclease III [Candidatus Dojkabacteria bacterium]